MHYFMRQNLFENLDVIEVEGHTEETAKHIWIAGSRFSEDVPPQTLILDAAYGTKMADFFDTTIPLMSARLLNALAAVGVSNLDVYPMILQRSDTSERWDNYSAVNVIGAIDAIDLENSEYTTDSFGEPNFTRIALKEDLVSGLKLFRLNTGPGLIVINEVVKDALSGQDFYALMLQPLEDYDGD